MTKAYPVGSTVSWSCGRGKAEGRVDDVFKTPVQRAIRGSKIVRRASDENPAYLVERSDGQISEITF